MDTFTKKAVAPSTRVPRLIGASYITQMPVELKAYADKIDWQLAYFIQMSALHSHSIDVDTYKPTTAERAKLDALKKGKRRVAVL